MNKKIYELLFFAFLLFQTNAFAIPTLSDLENFLKKSTVTNIAEFDKQSEDFLSNVPLETAIAASHKLLIIACPFTSWRQSCSIHFK